MAINQRIIVHQGDLETVTINCVDSAGDAVDVSGYTDFELRFFPISSAGVIGTQALALDLASGLTLTTDGTDGVLSAPLLEAATEALSGAYVFHLRSVDASSKSRYPLFGILTVLPTYIANA